MTKKAIQKAAEALAAKNGGEVRQAKKTAAKPHRPRPTTKATEAENDQPAETPTIETTSNAPTDPVMDDCHPVEIIGETRPTTPQNQSTFMPPATSAELMMKDMMEDILGGNGAQEAAIAIQTSIGLANNKAIIARFVETIFGCDDMVEAEVGLAQIRPEAREEWYRLDYAGLKKAMQERAIEGNRVAIPLSRGLEKFEATALDITALLWILASEIARPARKVNSYWELGDLMRRLQDKGFADFLGKRQKYPDGAIVFGYGGFIPHREGGKILPLAEAGWSFLQAAEIKAKNRAAEKEQKLEDIKSEATPDFTPEDAKGGKEGKVFRALGPRSGVLFHFNHQRVRLATGMGMDMKPTSGFVTIAEAKKYWLDKEVVTSLTNWWEGRVYNPPKPKA